MKRILIFSDTHNDTTSPMQVIMQTKAVDAIIHAGDCVRDAQDLEAMFPQIPVYYVMGNNDFFSNAPRALNVTIGKKNIFIVHGHNERVKYEYTLSTLIEKGQRQMADLIVFGHTHKPLIDYHKNMTILNPGSLKYGGTYAVCEIENDKLKVEIKNYR